MEANPSKELPDGGGEGGGTVERGRRRGPDEETGNGTIFVPAKDDEEKAVCLRMKEERDRSITVGNLKPGCPITALLCHLILTST